VRVEIMSVTHILTSALEAAGLNVPQAPLWSPIMRWVTFSRDGVGRVIQRLKSAVQRVSFLQLRASNTQGKRPSVETIGYI
jgi:hypothetical protein